MATNWTNDQLKAITAYNEPIIVSAAAGSGKTAVLVERTIRLLSDSTKNIPADRILAVTFTNDAASQMRRKLSDALETASLDDPDNQWLLRQQSLFRLAEVTTINSFCYSLLKDNIASTDFQSGVRILEETEAKMLTERALTSVLENEYTTNPNGIEELISLFCHENDSALRELIKQLYAFLRSLPYKDFWINKCLTSLRNGEQAKKAKEYFAKKAREKANLLRNICTRLEDCCEALENYKNQVAAFNKNIALALSLADDADTLSWSDFREKHKNFPAKSLSGKRSDKEKENTSSTEAAFYETAKNFNNALKDIASEIISYFKYSDEAISADAMLVADVFEKLCTLCQKLDDEVHRLKVERNAVDFADTELIAVSLLSDCDENGNITRTPLAEEIISSQRYKLIIIDEFQDVNNLQDVIFKIISNTDDLNKIGSNLFAVGDVKQSIYRFRLSNPKVFMNTRRDAKDPDCEVREILLAKNFRSRNSVLKFANYIFSSLMCQDLGETEYTAEEELVKGAEYSGEDAPTKVLLVNSFVDPNDESGEVLNEYDCIAHEIKKMIIKGVTVKDGDTVRPCRPSDFCVLTRTNIKDPSLTDSFSRYGLKVLASDKEGYLKSREISVLLNLLSIINSPMHDLPLASVMLSPIMGFSDDDISLIKLCDKKAKLYKTVLNIANGEISADETIYKKCKQAVALIKKLRVYAAGMPLTRLIKKVYDVTDMFSIAARYEDGEQKLANLYLLLEYAQSLEASSNDGIAGFLRYIDYISSTGGDFEQAYTVTESDDCVTVKTIHRSKGLEYPFVFLCQLGRKINKSDTYGRLQLNYEHGVGIKFLDYTSLTKRGTIFADYISSKNKQEMLSEELRLLYVAATRAKEQLFVVLTNAEKTAAKYAPSVTSLKIPAIISSDVVTQADWIIMALLKHPEFQLLRDTCLGYTFEDKYTDEENLPKIVVEPFVLTNLGGTENEETTAGRPIVPLVEKLKSNYSYSYDSRLTENEAKVSVSELVSDDPISFFPRVTRLDDTLGELSAAEKGTVTHRFMQYSDYAAASTDLEGEISRLKSLSLFTSKEADAINRESIKAFFESDIYSRLSKSGNVMREKQFIVRFSDISVDEALKEIYNDTDGMLQGIADCLFEEEDGYVLIDYKTDRVKTPEELLQRYTKQLELYKAAFGALLDKPIKSAFVYSFVLKKGIEAVL